MSLDAFNAWDFDGLHELTDDDGDMVYETVQSFDGTQEQIHCVQICEWQQHGRFCNELIDVAVTTSGNRYCP